MLNFGNPRDIDLAFLNESMASACRLGYFAGETAQILEERYTQSLCRAQAFASAGNLHCARLSLQLEGRRWKSEHHKPSPHTRLCLSLPSCLDALSILAETLENGWSLVVEDCPFSQKYLAGLSKRLRSQSLQLIPLTALSKAARQPDHSQTPQILVTFPDRPFASFNACVPVQIQNQGFTLSIAEALLTKARVAAVLHYGTSLHLFECQRDGSSEISQSEVMATVQSQAACLAEQLSLRPIEYLGWPSLFSRSRLYHATQSQRQQELFRSLLQYCQYNGLALKSEDYKSLLKTITSAQRPQTQSLNHALSYTCTGLPVP